MSAVIIKAPDERLRQVSAPFDWADEDCDLVSRMFEAMYAASGIGLSAVQIGVPKRLCVIDLQSNGVKRPRVFVNPVVLSASPKLVGQEEGCLSVPSERAVVNRSPYIALRWRTLDNSEFHDDFGGLYAHVLQHEIDHMDGVLFTDRASMIPAPSNSAISDRGGTVG